MCLKFQFELRAMLLPFALRDAKKKTITITKKNTSHRHIHDLTFSNFSNWSISSKIFLTFKRLSKDIIEKMAAEQISIVNTGPQNVHQMAYQGDLQQVKVRVLENSK